MVAGLAQLPNYVAGLAAVPDLGARLFLTKPLAGGHFSQASHTIGSSQTEPPQPPLRTPRPPAFTIVNATITRTDLRIEHPFD
jgi:hypothetical protein